MSFVVVIPARYHSTRLPAKPLLMIEGKTMIQHVWERATESSAEAVIVATDDPRIEDCCNDFGARVMLTQESHSSGTDRLAEVAERLGLAEEAIVVNVQGDEPLIPPAVIDQVAKNLSLRPQVSIATLCEPIVDIPQLQDRNAVKVVFDEDGLALYFSRAPIPWPRDYDWSGDDLPAQNAWWRHLGIYAYRAGFLHRFTGWPPAPIERLESLEQLRALHHGERIHVEASCESVPGGVDTAEDLEALRAAMARQSVSE